MDIGLISYLKSGNKKISIILELHEVGIRGLDRQWQKSRVRDLAGFEG